MLYKMKMYFWFSLWQWIWWECHVKLFSLSFCFISFSLCCYALGNFMWIVCRRIEVHFIWNETKMFVLKCNSKKYRYYLFKQSRFSYLIVFWWMNTNNDWDFYFLSNVISITIFLLLLTLQICCMEKRFSFYDFHIIIFVCFEFLI